MKKKYKKNPALVIVTNPVKKKRIKRNPVTTKSIPSFRKKLKGDIISDRVIELRYLHYEDGKAYKHEFGLGVKMIALPNGDIYLTHPRKALWGDYQK